MEPIDLTGKLIPLSWHDAPSFDAALANFSGALETETETLFRLLDKYMTTGDEKYNDAFSQDAAGYVARSLAAMGFDTWEKAARQFRTWLAIAIQSDPIVGVWDQMLVGRSTNPAEQATFLVSFVWPTLKRTAAGHKQMASVFGLTYEKYVTYARTDLGELSRLYAVAKKEHRLPPPIPYSLA